MAGQELDKAGGLQSIQTNVIDNTNRLVTESIIRDQLSNVWESFFNKISDAELVGLRPLSDRPYAIGDSMKYDDGTGIAVWSAVNAVAGLPFNGADWVRTGVIDTSDLSNYIDISSSNRVAEVKDAGKFIFNSGNPLRDYSLGFSLAKPFDMVLLQGNISVTSIAGVGLTLPDDTLITTGTSFVLDTKESYALTRDGASGFNFKLRQIGGIQIPLYKKILVSKSRGSSSGLPYRSDKPYDTMQPAIDIAAAGDEIIVEDGIFDVTDRFILKDGVKINFVSGTEWVIIGEDGSLDKAEGRICKNIADVSVDIYGDLDIKVLGQLRGGVSFPRLFAFTGNSIMNVTIRDVFASSQPEIPSLSFSAATLVDSGDTVQCNFKMRDCFASQHNQFSISNCRQDSRCTIIARNVDAYRFVSTRNNAQAVYKANNLVGTSLFVENNSRAVLKCFSLDFADMFDCVQSGTIKSLCLQADWVFLPVSNALSKLPRTVTGFLDIRKANIIGFSNNILGRSDLSSTFPLVNYLDNSLIFDDVKVISDVSNTVTSLSPAPLQNKIVNTSNFISTNNFDTGTTLVGNATVESAYQYNYGGAMEDFPNYTKIMWSWSSPLCVKVLGANNGNYRRKTITSSQYLGNVLNGSYTPIVADITSAFAVVDDFGNILVNESSLTDIQLQELSDADYNDRLAEFYWYIRLTYDRRFVFRTISTADSYPNVSALDTEKAFGLADLASGVSCVI